MDLKSYLDEYGIPISRFARRCGVSYISMRNLLKGRSKNILLSTAIAIVKNTRGNVTYEEILTKPKPKEEPKKKAARGQRALENAKKNSDALKHHNYT